MAGGRVLDEGLNLGVDFSTDLGIEVNEEAEESDEVYQASDGQDGGVAELLNQVCNMSDNELRNHLDDHGRLKRLAG